MPDPPLMINKNISEIPSGINYLLLPPNRPNEVILPQFSCHPPRMLPPTVKELCWILSLKKTSRDDIETSCFRTGSQEMIYNLIINQSIEIMVQSMIYRESWVFLRVLGLAERRFFHHRMLSLPLVHDSLEELSDYVVLVLAKLNL